jgi:hypothetical protein
MKKQISLIVAVTLILALSLSLFGCAGTPLPEGFDKDEVGTAAEEIVGLATAGDFDAIIASLREDVAASITADQLKEGWAPAYQKAGAFVSITKTALSGVTDKATGEEYAVAQVLVKHEGGSLVYTLSFDQDMMLVGLYLK